MINAHSPACPGCGALITKVIDTKFDKVGGHIVRRRHCTFCDARFYTGQAVEQIVDVKWTRERPGKSIATIVRFRDEPFRRPATSTAAAPGTAPTRMAARATS